MSRQQPSACGCSRRATRASSTPCARHADLRYVVVLAAVTAALAVTRLRAKGAPSACPCRYPKGAALKLPSLRRQGYGSHPPPRRGSLPLWTDAPIPLLPRLPASRRIYCNRALNMKQIKVQGNRTRRLLSARAASICKAQTRVAY